VPELAQYEAVRLFIERAIAVQPSFSVTNENAPAVAQICIHLDGIPLAIELAAARTRLLSPDQISARLSDRFNLLTGGSRTALPRHQTLRAAMDWSYDLLSEAERTLFNRLAVFAGSFSLEAAESICSNENAGETLEWINHPSQVLDLLGALVDHSLVSVQERNAETRYILLETVRQYALEKLQASGEWTNLQDRHLVYYVEFAERGSLHVANGQPVWLEQFETEYGNLRVAMEYAIASHPESAILLENPLGWFCEFSSRQRESYGWAMRILALTEAWPSGKMRAMALWHAGDRMRSVGEHKQGQVLMEAGLEMAKEFGDKYLAKDILEHLTTSIWNDRDWARLPNYANQYLEISRELEDKIGIQISLHLLGEAACGNGDNRTGRMLIEQALELGRQDNHQTLISMTLASLARLARLEKDNARAIALYMESAQVRREMGWRASVPGTLINMCQVYLQEGNSEQVRVLTEECLAIYKDLPEILESDLLYCLANFAGAAGNAGQDGRAACLFGAVEAVAEDLGIVMDEFDHAAYDPIIAAVRQRLGEADFNAAWAEGRKMNLEQALDSRKERE